MIHGGDPLRNDTKQLTEGAILAALYAVLFAISTYVPVLYILVIWFLPLPFIMYTWKYGRKAGVLFFVLAMILSFFVNPGLFNIPFGFVFGLIGLVVGELSRKESKVSEQILKSTIVSTLALTLFVGIARFVFDLNIFKQLGDEYRTMTGQLINVMKQTGQDVTAFELMMDQYINMLFMLAPMMLISLGATFSILSIVLAKPILKRLGFDVPKAEPLRLFSLPRFFAIYYAIILFLMLFTKPESSLYVFVLNVYYLFMILMVIQGVAALMAFMYKKGLSIAAQRFIVVLLFLLIFPIEFVHILGIIDLAFDLRKRINRKD